MARTALGCTTSRATSARCGPGRSVPVISTKAATKSTTSCRGLRLMTIVVLSSRRCARRAMPSRRALIFRRCTKRRGALPPGGPPLISEKRATSAKCAEVARASAIEYVDAARAATAERPVSKRIPKQVNARTAARAERPKRADPVDTGALGEAPSLRTEVASSESAESLTTVVGPLMDAADLSEENAPTGSGATGGLAASEPQGASPRERARRSKNFACDRCGARFESNRNLQRHATRKRRCLPILDYALPAGAPDVPNRCHYCGQVYSRTDSLARHVKVCKAANDGEVLERLAARVVQQQLLRKNEQAARPVAPIGRESADEPALMAGDQ
jgi:hypothetical protein